jgi:replication factor C subunit 3/5
MRVAAPNLEEVSRHYSTLFKFTSPNLLTKYPQMQIVLEHVAKKLKFDLPEEASQQIADDSSGNMRKALLVFEALKMQS